jgi:hypothetical protein
MVSCCGGRGGQILLDTVWPDYGGQGGLVVGFVGPGLGRYAGF